MSSEYFSSSKIKYRHKQDSLAIHNVYPVVSNMWLMNSFHVICNKIVKIHFSNILFIFSSSYVNKQLFSPIKLNKSKI